MAIPTEFLEEIRRRLALSAVVGRSVRLVRKGRDFMGLCPFHNEKSPSFTVNDAKGFYHCFGCGAHGDVIGFVMNQEGLAFPEAIERLAGEAGLEVPRAAGPIDPAEKQRRVSVEAATEAACVFFEQQLNAPVGREALDYLERRGVGRVDRERFRLGFAPDQRTALKSYLTGKGIPDEIQVEAGLLIKPEEGGASYDRFRGRVMFPIGDRRGRIIAFGGRIMGDGQPKYLNSPETPLFHKGRTLYALHLAREATARGAEAIAVEGYMDALALHRAGFAGAVAPLGTALTEEQMQELWRLNKEPMLCFDGDGAGQRAAARAAERALPLLEAGKSLRFLVLPPGLDPDDLVGRPGGVADFRELMASARPLVDMLWTIERDRGQLDTPERRADLRLRLRGLVEKIADKDVREFYKAEFDARQRRLFGGAQAGNSNQWQSRPKAPWRPGRRDEPVYVSSVPANMTAADHAGGSAEAKRLLAILLSHPALIGEFLEPLAETTFEDGDLDRFRSVIVNSAGSEPDLDSSALHRHIGSAGYASLLAGILKPPGYWRNGRSWPVDSLEDGREQVLAMLSGMAERRARQALRAEFEQAAQDESPGGQRRLLALLEQVREHDSGSEV